MIGAHLRNASAFIDVVGKRLLGLVSESEDDLQILRLVNFWIV